MQAIWNMDGLGIASISLCNFSFSFKGCNASKQCTSERFSPSLFFLESEVLAFLAGRSPPLPPPDLLLFRVLELLPPVCLFPWSSVLIIQVDWEKPLYQLSPLVLEVTARAIGPLVGRLCLLAASFTTESLEHPTHLRIECVFFEIWCNGSSPSSP